MRNRNATGFMFRSIRVFDPVATMRRGALTAVLSVSLTWLLGPWVGTAALLAAFGVMWKISRSDASKLTCISLQINDPVLRAVNVSDTGIIAEVGFSDGSVARVDRTLRRHLQISATPGVRVLPLVYANGGSTAAWFDHGMVTKLSLDEVRGALSVVLGGADLRLEVLVGSMPSTPPRAVAVCVSSSEGALHSWDEALDPQISLSASPSTLDFSPPDQTPRTNNA